MSSLPSPLAVASPNVCTEARLNSTRTRQHWREGLPDSGGEQRMLDTPRNEDEAAVRTRTPLGSPRAIAGAAIGSVGMAVPERVIENAPISERLGVDDDWIVSRTGVSRRHALGPDERLTDIAAQAGAAALADAGLSGSDLDLVIVGTTSKDRVTPDAAPVVAAELGAARGGGLRRRRGVHRLCGGRCRGAGPDRERHGGERSGDRRGCARSVPRPRRQAHRRPVR